MKLKIAILAIILVIAAGCSKVRVIDNPDAGCIVFVDQEFTGEILFNSENCEVEINRPSPEGNDNEQSD